MLEKGSKKAKDAELVVRFTEWYCAAHHQDVERPPLESPGVDAGIYGTRIPRLCTACADYARYAEHRTELCRQQPKPFCAVCKIKCYKPDMAEYSRKVMRYSGPRSIFSRYCLRAVGHAYSTLRYHKNRRASSSGN
ncbi:MAG: nitrous oxide-stimulated promoter family protein [Coriobacteriia bacterium]|nr:nitrous oxide-stimulated promoter family protein [Coriobacteriia bacterium]